MIKSVRSFIVAALAVFTFGCDFQSIGLKATSHSWLSYLHSLPDPDHVDLSQAHFVFDDFGTLNDHALKTNALPWKLYSTALLLSEAERFHLPYTEASVFKIMERYGFFRPTSIANWEHDRSPEPKITEPLGLQKGIAKTHIPGIKLEIANINCAACHAGVTYTAQGEPTREAWLGAPNTSINFEGFVSSIYKGLKIAASNQKLFIQKIKETYPNISSSEKRTIEWVFMPLFSKQMKIFKETIDRPLPFTAGGPGLTNGLGALKQQMGTIDIKTFLPHDAYLVSIPELGNRAFRSSLLADGTYSLPYTQRFETITAEQATPARLDQFADIVAFFIVPSAASTFQNAARVIPDVKNTLGFLSRYQSPRFPGRLDSSKIFQGSQLFAKRCAECHGTYAAPTMEVMSGMEKSRLLSFPNRLIPQAEMGTDSTRWEGITQELLTKIRNERGNPLYDYVNPARTEGYVAPLLSGLWISAPYLHNGSVPTLWHLMHPEERPSRFYVGGHKLDFEKVGIAGHLDSNGVYIYPDTYSAWSEPTLYDTQTPGRANGGHTEEFKDLSEDDKMNLLEFLKTL